MSQFKVYDHNKNEAGSIELSDNVFGAEVNPVFLHQVLVCYQANKRQGTVKTKNRNEVSGGGKKPYRQKGTGRARQGTTRAPHHRGGATQFGPVPKTYKKTVSKKMKREAFRQCLSMKNRDGGFFVLTDLDFPEIKTKRASELLRQFESGRKALFIDVEVPGNAKLSIRNLASAKVLETGSCSPLDIFESDTVFMTKAAAEQFQQRYAQP